MTDPAIEIAVQEIQRIKAEAEIRAPHLALELLLAIMQRVEAAQGCRVTELQTRIFAAFLRGAEKLPADAPPQRVAPDWIVPSNGTEFLELFQEFVAAGALGITSSAITRPGSADIVQDIARGQNDAYRSQRTIKVDGHLGNVGSDKGETCTGRCWRHWPPA